MVMGLLVGLGLWSEADATQMTFGDSSAFLPFTGNGADAVSVSTAGLSGYAFFGRDFGTLSFGAVSFTTGPENTPLYAAGPTTPSLTFTAQDGDTLTAMARISNGKVPRPLLQTPEPSATLLCAVGLVLVGLAQSVHTRIRGRLYGWLVRVAK